MIYIYIYSSYHNTPLRRKACRVGDVGGRILTLLLGYHFDEKPIDVSGSWRRKN